MKVLKLNRQHSTHRAASRTHSSDFNTSPAPPVPVHLPFGALPSRETRGPRPRGGGSCAVETRGDGATGEDAAWTWTVRWRRAVSVVVKHGYSFGSSGCNLYQVRARQQQRPEARSAREERGELSPPQHRACTVASALPPHAARPARPAGAQRSRDPGADRHPAPRRFTEDLSHTDDSRRGSSR